MPTVGLPSSTLFSKRGTGQFLMEQIKKQVLDQIANGRRWYKAGQAKYRIGEKTVHVRFRSDPKSDKVTYAYGINQNTLSADFEIWICGDVNTYYFIPINVIKSIYNDPGAYVDKMHPKIHVADINISTHRTLHSRHGNTEDLSPYFRRVMPLDTPKAYDLNEPNETTRTLIATYRILRDTETARNIKELHGFKCQICGEVIYLKNNKPYAEAHHIKPLGTPHNGPDIPENILCVCPNHHVRLDYGAVKIETATLRIANGHTIGKEFVEYHNNEICGN